MKVAFDLDGVLRELSLHLVDFYGCPYPEQWDFQWNGKSFYKLVDECDAIRYAPVTSYAWALSCTGTIWTSQPTKWRGKTKKWIDDNLGKHINVVYFNNPEDKFQCLQDNKDYVLVEDYPNFPNYNRIILIDRPYNQNVNATVRVHNINELQKEIERCCNGKTKTN